MKTKSWIYGAWAVSLSLILVAAGCAPDIPQDEDVERTQVVFDPDEARIPTPNDAALDPTDGTLPDLPATGEDSPEGVFADYFTSLNGWPTATPITIPVDGAINPETLGMENVVLFQFGADEVTELEVASITFDEGASQIQVTPAAPLMLGTRYGFVLHSDQEATDTRVEDPEGNVVVGSQAIFFATFEEALVDENDEPTVDLLEGEAETAQSLEGLRQLLSPAVGAAVEQGIERDNILSASVWTTTSNPIAVFNPDTATLPTPHDAALEADGTIPPLPGFDEASAQGDFLSYLDTLHGWLPSTPLEVPFSKPLDEDTVDADAFALFRFEEDGSATELDIAQVMHTVNDDGTAKVTIVPAETLELGTRYGYIASDQLADEQGLPARADLPMALASSEQPLVDAEGASQISRVTDEQAQQLEPLRQLLAPTYAAAETAGVERSNVVASAAWHTADDAFAVFDPNPANPQVPFPNEFVRPGGSVSIPVPDGADPLTTAVITELNRRDGFSITADGWIPIQGAALDPTTVNETNIPLAFVPGALPSLYEEDRYFTSYEEDFGAIIFGPEGQPFVQNRTNAGIVLTDVKDVNGRDIKPTSAFVFLRSQYPVFENGESTVDQLDDATAELLEDARQSYQQLFSAALVLGYPDRSEIALAWAFEADEATRDQQELNAQAIALANEGGSPAAQGDPTNAEVAPAGFTNVGLLQSQASYTTQFFIDANAEGGLADVPAESPVPMTIAVPDTATCGAGPYPVVIAGYIDGQPRDAVVGVLADRLAAECLITVVPAFPFEGARAVQDVDFLSANPIATKNNMMQAVVDLAVLVEVIEEGGLEGVLSANPASDLVDETSIGYAGLSVGSLVGTNFLATVPEVSVGTLTEAGAKITQIVLEGALSAILPQELLDLQGTFEGFRIFGFLQWVLEHADPWTFARHVQSQPLAQLSYDIGNDEFNVDDQNDVGTNEVLIQMAGDDQVIPNSTTELLANAIGVSLDDTTFPGVGHLFITGATPEAECARDQIAVWLSSGLTTGDAELGASELNACGLGN